MNNTDESYYLQQRAKWARKRKNIEKRKQIEDDYQKTQDYKEDNKS